MKNYEFLIKLLKKRDLKNFYSMLNLTFTCPTPGLCPDNFNCYDCWCNWLKSDSKLDLDEVKD